MIIKLLRQAPKKMLSKLCLSSKRKSKPQKYFEALKRGLDGRNIKIK